MKRLLILCCLIWSVAQAQIANYSTVNGGYRYTDRITIEKGITIPSVGTPALATYQYGKAGAIVVDTTGGDAGFYFYMNGTWIRLADTSFASRTLQQVLTAGSALTVGINNVTGASSGLYFTNKSFVINAVDSVFLANQACPDCYIRITATGETELSAANTITLDASDIKLSSIPGSHNANDSMLVWNPTSKITGYRPIPTGGGGSTLTNIGTGISIGVDATNNTKKVDGINSISADSTTTANTVTFKLVNDQTSPGNNYIYSVSPGGIKQWNKSFPVTFTAPTDGQYLRITISGTDTSFTNSTISVSPGGNTHNVQLNRSSLFAGTDSLQFYTSALRVTGSYYNNGYIGLYMHPTMTQTVMVGTNSLGSFSHASGSEGYYNTGVGYFALNGNTTGYGNTAVGRYAMGNATVTGTNNTGIGAGALLSLTSGTSNTAVGDNALQANQSGNQNTAIGRTALNSNTGTGNVAIGFQSVYSNTSGGSNTGFGTNALYYNQTGSRNVAIGYTALQGASTNSFSNATAIGYAAGLSNTTGSAGIFIGDSAGYNNTTGLRNIVIGTNLTASSPTANYEMNIGGLIYGTGMTGTGTTSAGLMGVRTQSPTHELTVNGQVKILSPQAGDSSPDSLAGFKDGVLSAITTVYSGTYTPTLNNTTNVTSSTAYECQYIRVGNTVTVSGMAELTVTTGGLNTELGISLPVASNFANNQNCGGSGSSESNTEAAAIFADPANDRARIQYPPAASGSRLIHFSFTYRII